MAFEASSLELILTEPANSGSPVSQPRWRWPLGAAIVLFWLLMMGLLARRELGGRRVEADGAAGPRRASAETLFLALKLPDGERVGLFQMAQAPERRQDRDGVRTNLLARVALDLMGKKSHLRVQGVLWQGGDLAELDARARSADTDFHVEGRLAGGKLAATLETAGEKIPFSLDLGSEVFLDTGLGAALRLPTCQEGEVLRFESFDPLSMSSTPARLECLGEETLELADERTLARKLKVSSGGLDSVAYIDGDGNVLRAETPFGFVLEKISAQEALEPIGEPGEAASAAGDAAGAQDGPGWLGLTAVKAQGEKPVRGARRLLLKVDGGPPPPADGAQAPRADGSFEVFADRRPGAAESGAPSPEERASFLRAEPLIQSEHPKIVAMARQIVGGETDPAKQALLLHDWVFRRLDKEPVLSLPSALEVLERRRGDCNEHAVLYTALARAAGLPSRVAVGLVWSDENAGFFYHAWPEVLLADGWHRLDPTLDQPAADATHLKLLEGGVESWPQLLPFLGRLRIEVLEVEPGSAAE